MEEVRIKRPVEGHIRLDMMIFYWNGERGPALLPQRKENPYWNE